MSLLTRIQKCKIYNDKVNIYELPLLDSYIQQPPNGNTTEYIIEDIIQLEESEYCEIKVDTTFISKNKHYQLSPLYMIYIPITHLFVYGKYLFYCLLDTDKQYIKNMERREYMSYYKKMQTLGYRKHKLFFERNIQRIIFEYVYGLYIDSFHKFIEII